MDLSFRAPWWLTGPHAQTLGGKFLRRPGPLLLRRERLDLPDGDFVDLDLAPNPSDEAPLAVVLHGLEGNARRGYAIQAYQALLTQGIQPVGLNFRGCSGEPNRLARAYHSGETGDLGLALAWLRDRYPGRPIGLLGFSLGGNVSLKYLGECGRGSGADQVAPKAACAISVPYDLSAGADALQDGGMAHLYSLYFLRSLRRKLETKRNLMEPLIDLPRALAASTIREFDERVTSVIHGFSGAEDYYTRSSSLPYLADVMAPTLLIHSWDDPFLPRETVSQVEGIRNPALTRAFTLRGGHVGFISGSGTGRTRFWAEETAARFLGRELRKSEARST